METALGWIVAGVFFLLLLWVNQQGWYKKYGENIIKQVENYLKDHPELANATWSKAKREIEKFVEENIVKKDLPDWIWAGIWAGIKSAWEEWRKSQSPAGE